MSVYIKILEFKNKKLQKEHLINNLSYNTVLDCEKNISQSYIDNGYTKKTISHRILTFYENGEYAAVVAIHKDGLCMTMDRANLPTWADLKEVYFTLSELAINNA